MSAIARISNSRRQSAGSRRSLRLVTQSNSPVAGEVACAHADIGRGARPNSNAREAMSTSDTEFGKQDHHCKTGGHLHLYRVWRHFSQATNRLSRLAA